MDRGLDGSKAGHRDQQCLGLFILYGGSKVKEVYQLHKDDDKDDDNHNNYQHAGAMVEKVLVSEKNETYESFKFWNVKQRTGERFDVISATSQSSSYGSLARTFSLYLKQPPSYILNIIVHLFDVVFGQATVDGIASSLFRIRNFRKHREIVLLPFSDAVL